MVNKKQIPMLLFVVLPIIVICSLYSGNIKTITKIVDGDTIYFDNRYKCRINFIDTPERRHNSKLERDRTNCPEISSNKFISAGKLSTEHANSVFKTGEKAKVEILGMDTLGKRNICSILILPDEEAFSMHMVENGFAIPDFRFIPSDMTKKWFSLLVSARSKDIGLWKSHNDVLSCMLENSIYED